MRISKTTSLFDGVRHYAGPALHTESSFHFLNRAAGDSWQAARELLDAWYAKYPDATGDLRARFRQDDSRQHVAAWWELYVYTLFVKLGYSVDVHPSIDGTDHQPDFGVSKHGADTMYVECAALLEDASEFVSDGQAWVFDCIDTVDSSDFIADITVERVGSQRPRKQEITGPVDRWLQTLDWREVTDEVDRSGNAPEKTFVVRDWQFTLGAWPVRPGKRGVPGRFIGGYLIGDAEPRFDEQRLRDLIADKGGRYGSAQPLVLAVLAWSSFMDERDLTNALFGSIAAMYYQHSAIQPKLVRQRDGYWRPTGHSRGSRLGGVLFGNHLLKPWDSTSSLPQLWINPWAASPIDSLGPFGIHTAQDSGVIVSTEATGSAQDIFHA